MRDIFVCNVAIATMAIISFNVDHMKNRCDVILKTVERFSILVLHN
jgi:hypothetical protein